MEKQGIVVDKRQFQPQSVGWNPPADYNWLLVWFGPEERSYRLPVSICTAFTDEQVSGLGLQQGDLVRMEDDRIVKVNGVDVPYFLFWPWPGWKVPRPTVVWKDLSGHRREVLDTSRNALANLVGSLFPLVAGSSYIVVGLRQTKKSIIIRSLVDALSKTGNLVMYFVMERVAEVPAIEEDPEAPNHPVVPQGVELWALTTRERESPQDFVTFANLCFAVAKVRALSGQNVIVVIDSLKVLADALNRVLTTAEGPKSPILSGGLAGETLDAVAARYLASAGHPSGAGSLTVLGTFMVNPADAGTRSLAETVEGTADGHMIMLPPQLASATCLPIELSQSSSRYLEAVVGPEVQRIWDFKDTVEALEKTYYNRLRENAEKDLIRGGRSPNLPQYRVEQLRQEAMQLAEEDRRRLLELAHLPPEQLREEGMKFLGKAPLKPNRVPPEPPPTLVSDVVETTKKAEPKKVAATTAVPTLQGEDLLTRRLRETRNGGKASSG